MSARDDLRSELDMPPSNLRGGSPRVIFEYASAACDVFEIVGWIGSRTDGPQYLEPGRMEWHPCDPKRPAEIHPACVRFVSSRKVKRGRPSCAQHCILRTPAS